MLALGWPGRHLARGLVRGLGLEPTQTVVQQAGHAAMSHSRRAPSQSTHTVQVSRRAHAAWHAAEMLAGKGPHRPRRHHLLAVGGCLRHRHQAAGAAEQEAGGGARRPSPGAVHVVREAVHAEWTALNPKPYAGMDAEAT